MFQKRCAFSALDIAPTLDVLVLFIILKTDTQLQWAGGNNVQEITSKCKTGITSIALSLS